MHNSSFEITFDSAINSMDSWIISSHSLLQLYTLCILIKNNWNPHCILHVVLNPLQDTKYFHPLHALDRVEQGTPFCRHNVLRTASLLDPGPGQRVRVQGVRNFPQWVWLGWKYFVSCNGFSTTCSLQWGYKGYETSHNEYDWGGNALYLVMGSVPHADGQGFCNRHQL
jgi:hypothetical protein